MFNSPIRAIFHNEWHWFESIYKVAESGEIQINSNDLRIRIGAVTYTIEKIYELKIRRPQFEKCIEISGLINREKRVLYVYDYKYFGIINLISDLSSSELFKKLKQFQKRQE